MSQMNNTTYNQIKPIANYFKNLVIILGVFLSLLTFTSFNNWGKSVDTQDDGKVENLIVSNAGSDQKNGNELTVSKNEQKLKAHHNFIASYLLQESTFSRKSEKNKEQSNLFTNLKQIHKIIIVQMLGAI